MEIENQILLGPCLEILRKIPDNTYDATVMDPPYGIGNREPKPEEILAYLQGSDLDTGGDFMGKDWEIPSVLVWKEIFRVTKPGGHVLSFGGTRTWDLISMGARMAGFEKMPSIAQNHAGLQWIQSQGMPKSHNVAKALSKKIVSSPAYLESAYEPALRNAYCVCLQRAEESSPLESGTRQESRGSMRPLSPSDRSSNKSSTVYDPDHREVRRVVPDDSGRWGHEKARTCSWCGRLDKAFYTDLEGLGTGLKPTWEPIVVFAKPLSEKTIVANVLKHKTGILNIDAVRVKHSSRADFEEHKKQVEAVQNRGGVRGNSWKNSSDLSGANDVSLLGRWPPDTIFTHAPGCLRSEDPDRTLWVCVEGCPVAELDRQSGDRPSTLTGRADPSTSHDHPGEDKSSKSLFLGERTHLSTVYADSGGISRVFPQFEEDVVPFFYTGKASKKEVTLNGEIENDHPTKKPLALMRWLVRLAARKGGLILDPYCGSGSTLHAAFEERVRYTGIEKDPHNYEIATKRLAIVQEVVGARQSSQDNFESWMSLPDDE